MAKHRAQNADEDGTHTAVTAGMPPMDCETAMAMGVVTDFGITEAAIFGETPSHSAIAALLTMAVRLPAKQTLMMDFQRARI